MKLTAQEEYGLRCLLYLTRMEGGGQISITEISEREKISVPYVAKLLRVLRQEGFVKSARGVVGGYELARPANQIYVSEVLNALGGRVFDKHFCERFPGKDDYCSRSLDCSLRTLWRTVQFVLDQVLGKITLRDLEDQAELDMVPVASRLVNLPPQSQEVIRKQVLGIKN